MLRCHTLDSIYSEIYSSYSVLCLDLDNRWGFKFILGVLKKQAMPSYKYCFEQAFYTSIPQGFYCTTCPWKSGSRQMVCHPTNSILKKARDAKGRKVSGNFGNFPWKVSGILKRWEFSEILGIFNLDLFSTFYEIVCTQININWIYFVLIPMHWFCTTFWQLAGMYGTKERTIRLYYELRLDTTC